MVNHALESSLYVLHCGGFDPASKVYYPKRPENFSGIWVNRHGVTARTEQEYVNGVASGVFRSIHESGVVLRECKRKDGLWHGTMIVRNSRGAILDESEFADGTGIYRIFNAAGQMTDEVPMVCGKSHGISRCWRLGKLVTTRYYTDGICQAAIIEGSTRVL